MRNKATFLHAAACFLAFTWSMAEAKCVDESSNIKELGGQGLSMPDFMTPISSCPVKNIVIRGPDSFAREGGGFLANRGKNRCHFALDLEVYNSVSPSFGEGEPVFAIDGGVVRLASKDWGAAGHTVIVEHGNNVYSIYAHLQAFGVKVGQKVRGGQKIASIGYTGNAKKMKNAKLPPHLHFALVRTVKKLGSWKPLSVVKELEKVDDDIPFMEGFGFIDPTNRLKTLGCFSS